MPWVLGGLGLYLVLLVTLGTLTFRRGHLILFAVGFIAPLCWLIGAVLRPAPGHGTAGPQSGAKHPEHHGRVTVNPD